ncbi:diguanylate cyclase domain-containing protein [Methylobacterium sp. P31]
MTARAGKTTARLARRGRRPVLGQRQDGPGRTRRLGPGILRALDSLPHGFCLFDAADRLLFVSDGFRRLFGQPARRVRPGMHARDVSAASAAATLGARQDSSDLWGARRRLAQGETATVLQMLPDGRQIAILLHPQVGGGWAALYEDVTERRRAEALLRYMAHHDPLTGLPNRYLFAARLDRALAAPGGGTCALLCIDLDGFKPVNDRYGHAAGDALLRQLAERLGEEPRRRGYRRASRGTSSRCCSATRRRHRPWPSRSTCTRGSRSPTILGPAHRSVSAPPSASPTPPARHPGAVAGGAGRCRDVRGQASRPSVSLGRGDASRSGTRAGRGFRVKRSWDGTPGPSSMCRGTRPPRKLGLMSVPHRDDSRRTDGD